MTNAHFGDKAHLYAENASVVRAMKDAFEADVRHFLDGVYDELLARNPRTQEKQTTGYRYWWLAESGLDKDACPQLWMSTDDEQLVARRLLTLKLGAYGELRKLESSFSHIANREEFQAYCSSETNSPLTLTIDVTDTQPITAIANSISRVLEALESIHIGISA